MWYEHAANALVMEAQAIRDRARLALERNYLAVEIETDAQEVLRLIEDPGGSKSEIVCICHEIKDLSGNFSSLKFCFIGRLANKAANNCA